MYCGLCWWGEVIKSETSLSFLMKKETYLSYFFSLHLVLNNLVIPVISNKLAGGMLNKITKCVAEKFIQQGKPTEGLLYETLYTGFSIVQLSRKKRQRETELWKCWNDLFKILCNLLKGYFSCLGDTDLSYSILYHLTKVPRFSTIAMFCHKTRRKVLIFWLVLWICFK